MLSKMKTFVVKNENIRKHRLHSICNFSSNVLLGQGNSSRRRRNIAESFAENYGKILAVQNFTKTITLRTRRCDGYVTSLELLSVFRNRHTTYERVTLELRYTPSDGTDYLPYLYGYLPSWSENDHLRTRTLRVQIIK